MRKPIFVRDLTEEERQKLKSGLRSSEPFTVRRSQIILSSARGEWVPRIAEFMVCDDQTVRNAITAFNERGVAAQRLGSRRPKTAEPIFTGERTEQLKALLHRRPRDFGKETSIWTSGIGRRSQFCRRHYPTFGQRRLCSQCPEAFECLLETSQALDHKS